MLPLAEDHEHTRRVEDPEAGLPSFRQHGARRDPRQALAVYLVHQQRGHIVL
eukprot:CAMPEP_0182573566 /NCGR_PEP_ID=MMETSP1324-20130603/20296_1 /TAXON_ID=236786 /ORGANISM="Florenciella sp., Strain RCC1587" /LENGTH=51 /DNA_ID=CAMNT_0024788697 /DNA_START=358 /DNA_END=510 /DNA_ORIENTATION=-